MKVLNVTIADLREMRPRSVAETFVGGRLAAGVTAIQPPAVCECVARTEFRFEWLVERDKRLVVYVRAGGRVARYDFGVVGPSRRELGCLTIPEPAHELVRGTIGASPCRLIVNSVTLVPISGAMPMFTFGICAGRAAYLVDLPADTYWVFRGSAGSWHELSPGIERQILKPDPKVPQFTWEPGADARIDSPGLHLVANAGSSSSAQEQRGPRLEE